MAGPRGVEPLTAVLETAIIPFNQGPIDKESKLFRFFVHRVLAAFFTMLFQLDLFNRLDIGPLGKIIARTANRAFQSQRLDSCSFFCHDTIPLRVSRSSTEAKPEVPSQFSTRNTNE